MPRVQCPLCELQGHTEGVALGGAGKASGRRWDSLGLKEGLRHKGEWWMRLRQQHGSRGLEAGMSSGL